jgi:hypothetical protein
MKTTKKVAWNNVTNVEISGNAVLLTYEEEDVVFTPKDGDFCADKDGNLMIFKEWTHGWAIGAYAGLALLTNGLFINTPRFTSSVVRFQTEQEKYLLLDGLKRAGLKWNAEERRIENIGLERVKDGDKFWAIWTDGGVVEVTEHLDVIGDRFFLLGNYFHTRQEAMDFFEKEIKPIYKKRK